LVHVAIVKECYLGEVVFIHILWITITATNNISDVYLDKHVCYRYLSVGYGLRCWSPAARNILINYQNWFHSWSNEQIC